MVPICLYCLNCMKFGQLILRNIIKIVATRCQILRLKCTQFGFGWGSGSAQTKDVKLKFFHNRSSNRYNRLKTGHRFHLCCRLRGGGRNRQILLRERCSISIGLMVGIRSPPLHSVACLCSQVAIEFGLGRRIRGDAGHYKLQ